ncbi:hypothetical protein DB347_20105 [Opitutaceae bacterium EW11]|nr:hypothetical protein DB347_20105 [Opitutaceae bacterium EW11]
MKALTQNRLARLRRLKLWTVVPTGLLAGAVSAQTSPSTSESSGGAPDTVELSPFVVRTDKDTGFIAASAQAGGRLATDLKDTPVSYSVINRELIDALGITDLTQAAEWTTNSFRFPDGAGGGDTFNITTPVAVRGILGNNPLRQRNFFPYYSENDSYNIERYDFGRGPNQVLFGNGTIGGTQVTMTKRPRFDKSFESVELTYGSWDNRRAVLDVNRALGDKFALRVAGLFSDRNGWRMREFEKRKAVFASAAYKLAAHTELRVEGEAGNIQRRIPDAKLNDRLAGWNGTYTANLLTSLPSNNGALGIDRRGGNYFVYNPVSGPDAVMSYTNWAITRGAGDTSTTPAGNYTQVGQVSWNQSNATILNAVDVVPDRFARAIANSKFQIPDTEFTNAPLTPLIDSKFKDAQITLSHQIGDSLFIEIAGDVNSVHSTINRAEADAITTYIDINPNLPNGQSNPNFLRPYGDARFWNTQRESDAKSGRFGVAYIKDLGKWGNYSFNFMGGMTRQDLNVYNVVLSPGVTEGQLADHRQWGNLNNGIRQRLYWGDSGAYVLPPSSITYVSSTGATSTATPQWVYAIADDSSNNVAKNRNDYNYLLAAMNAKYFNGRLVVLGAMRYDDSQQKVTYLVRQGDFSDSWDGRQLLWRPDAPSDWLSLRYTPAGAANPIYATTRPRTANSNGVQIANPAYANVRFMDDYNPLPVTAKVWSPSTGSVVHVTKWLSVFGNYSKAISFNTAAAPDVYGKLLPVVEGKGWDTGFRTTLFGGKMNFSATYYNNQEYGNYIDPTSVTNQINTLYQANVLGDTTVGGRNQRNAADINGLVRDTRTRFAKGYEFELVANLTKSWRLTANLALPKNTEREYGPMTRAYVAENAALFKQVLEDAGGTVGSDGIAVRRPGVADTGSNGNETSGNEAQRAVNAYNNIFANVANFVVNERPTTTSPHTANIFTDYTFREGKLKGLKFGAGMNYRGSRVVGYRGGDSIVDPANPARSIDDPSVNGYTVVVAPGSTLYTVSCGYTWKLRSGQRVSLDFRINNLLNEDDVIWTDTTSTLRPKGGDFTSPARETVYNPYAYQVPRSYSLTAKIEF